MLNKIGFLLFLCAATGCTDPDFPQEFPLVITGEVINISPAGAELVGDVKSLGEGMDVLGWGFVISDQEKPTLQSSVILASAPIEEGRFTQPINNDLVKDKRYYVRAFIQTSQLVVYGNEQSFLSQGSPAPVLLEFTPKRGFDGSEITISGKNFSPRPAGNLVKVGPLSCQVLAATTEMIKVRLPDSKLVGDYPISVEVGGNTIVSSTSYTVLGPSIVSISKTNGRVGDLISVEGAHFDVYHSLTVFFGEPEDWVYNSSIPDVKSPNQLEVRVPDHPGSTGHILLHARREDGEKQSVFSQNFSILDSWSLVSQQVPLYNRDGYSSAVVGNALYVVGGRKFYRLDPETMELEVKSEFPGDYRYFGTAFEWQGKFYYGFGEGHHEPDRGLNGLYYNDLWAYDPPTDTWRFVAKVPVEERSRMVSMAIDNKLYFGYGVNGGVNPKLVIDFWEYNLATNTSKSLSSPVRNYSGDAATYVADGKGYVIGLQRPESDNAGSLDFWEFDPASSSWQTKTAVPQPMRDIKAFNLDGNGLVIGGMPSNSSSIRVLEYNTELDEWIHRQELNKMGNHGYSVFSYYQNNKLYYGAMELWALSFN